MGLGPRWSDPTRRCSVDVFIDPSRCDGHALCVATAPHLFQIGSDGKSHLTVRSVAPEDERLVLSAEAKCPLQAIVALTDEEDET
jgi:ferredoxin